MNTLEMYNQRFIGNGQRVFAHALNGARRRGQNYVVVEHFIEIESFDLIMALARDERDDLHSQEGRAAS